jgi:hypothetical protein
MRACDSESSAAEAMEHADARHPLGLLRMRGDRPSRRTPEQRDELAPFCMSRKSIVRGDGGSVMTVSLSRPEARGRFG